MPLLVLPSLILYYFREKIPVTPKELPNPYIEAYKSTGLEYEFLGMKKEAMQMFYNGFSISRKILGKNKPITLELEKLYNKLVTTKLFTKREFQPGLRRIKNITPTRRTQTPDIIYTDRQLTDFISAPVNFENIIQSTTKARDTKINFRSETVSPTVRTGNLKKLSERVSITPKLPKKTKNHHFRSVLKNERLIPIPKKSKISLSAERLKKHVTSTNLL